jgi:hypothetical protein
VRHERDKTDCRPSFDPSIPFYFSSLSSICSPISFERLTPAEATHFFLPLLLFTKQFGMSAPGRSGEKEKYVYRYLEAILIEILSMT